MRHMGEEPSADVLASFESNLKHYRDTLIGFYRSKAKLTAEREAVRFQYLTTVKNQLVDIASQIANKAYEDKNDVGLKLWTYLIGAAKTAIPVVSLDGSRITGWKANAGVLGGRLGLGILSPINQFLVEPFNDPSNPDQRPAYLVYKGLFTSATWEPSVFVTREFFGSLTLWGVDENSSQQYIFSVPPRIEWVKAYLRKFYSSDSSAISAYQYVMDLISANWPAGNLIETIDKARGLFKEIVEKTVKIITTQYDIDALEAEFVKFVEDFRAQYGVSAVSASDILRELQELALQPDAQPEAIMAPTETIVEAPKKSVLPWVAAGIAALFVISRPK